jgi:predicted kinase
MEAIIFCGIQATGKSTFYIEHFFRTHIRINMDMLRTRHRETVLLNACMEAKQPFVVDNTNPTVAERARYVTLAYAAGFRIVGYYFQSKLADGIVRNEARHKTEQIPVKGIGGTYKRLVLPALEEGFDALFYVTLIDGGFRVQDWTNEV